MTIHFIVPLTTHAHIPPVVYRIAFTSHIFTRRKALLTRFNHACFKTSSRKATDVFKAREWVGVSSDNLVPHVLALISVFITLGSGCFGLVVEEFDGYSFTNFQKPTSTAFSIGCWIGFVISRILFKLVGSAVNTVLVCFSLAPWTFKVNHPVLSHEMRSSWGGTWLDEHEWLHNLENGEAKPNYIPR